MSDGLPTRVVAPWITGEARDGSYDDGVSGRWRVWVEREGRYELTGTYQGSEADAVAAALDATGADRAVAFAASVLLLDYSMKCPGDAATSRGSTPGGSVLMPSQVTPQNLGDQLRAAVEAIEGVTLQDRPSYYTVKYGTTTLGYVNGRRKFRVDLPIRGGKREQFFVTKSREIPRAVKLLTSFIPQEKAA